MGILNVTPDSFSDGGLYYDKEKALERAFELVREGADIVDIGGESTRPGSDPIPLEEELHRTIPVISALKKDTGVLISIDTTKSEVAEAAFEAGAHIINDISAGTFDPQILAVASRTGMGLVLMHIKGRPKTMQINPFYEDVLQEVKSYLKEKSDAAQNSGVKKESIVLDPGIGFGKRQKDNLILINNLHFFEDLGFPLLIGVSRKSFIGNILNLPPQERIEGSIAAAIISIQRGAHILRVHDVQATKRAIMVAEAILEESGHVC